MPDQTGPNIDHGESDWWSFVQAHELDQINHDDDEPEPTFATFSGPSGSGVTIYLTNGTEIEVTLGQGRNGYPHVATFFMDGTAHATPYRTTTKGQ